MTFLKKFYSNYIAFKKILIKILFKLHGFYKHDEYQENSLNFTGTFWQNYVGPVNFGEITFAMEISVE